MNSVDMAALYAWFVARSGGGSDGGSDGGDAYGSGSGGKDGGGNKEGSSSGLEGNCIRSLHVDVSTGAAWGPTLAVLGVVGRTLRHMRIAGDSPQCQLVGCSAPWLALCPNLASLELDDVVDHSIGDCTVFPTGQCCSDSAVAVCESGCAVPAAPVCGVLVQEGCGAWGWRQCRDTDTVLPIVLAECCPVPAAAVRRTGCCSRFCSLLAHGQRLYMQPHMCPVPAAAPACCADAGAVCCRLLLQG